MSFSRKKILSALALTTALAAALAAGCAHRASSKDSAAMEAQGSPDLVLIATTDFHATLDRAESEAQVVRALRAQYGARSLHLDGGDLFQGSIEGNMSKGRAIVAYYNALGVDAAAMGNHELDYGFADGNTKDPLSNLKARAKQARFAWLSANFVEKHAKREKYAKRCKPGPRCNALGERTILAPRKTFARNGQHICVIGATTPSTSSITRPIFLRDARFDSLEDIVPAEAKYMRAHDRCDFVILVAHAGLICKDGHCQERGDRAEILELLEKLPPKTVDAVVAGHTHLKAQEIIHGTPVIEAGAFAQTIGVLKLWKDGRSEFGEWHDVPSAPAPSSAPASPDVSDITALLKPYRDTAATIKNRVVGAAKAAFAKNVNAESALGDLVANAVLEEAQKKDPEVRCAFVNQGGLRAGLPAGTLTYGDIYKVLPFDNSLTIVQMTGTQLRRIMEIETSGGHGAAAQSGLKLKRVNEPSGARGPWDRDLNHDGKKEDWERNLLTEIHFKGGDPLENMHVYHVATIDFLAQGGDHLKVVFDTIPKSRVHIFEGLYLRDVLVDYLKDHPVVDPATFHLHRVIGIEETE